MTSSGTNKTGRDVQETLDTTIDSVVLMAAIDTGAEHVRAYLDDVFWGNRRALPDARHLVKALQMQNRDIVKLLVHWGACVTVADIVSLTEKNGIAADVYQTVLRGTGHPALAVPVVTAALPAPADPVPVAVPAPDPALQQPTERRRSVIGQIVDGQVVLVRNFAGIFQSAAGVDSKDKEHRVLIMNGRFDAKDGIRDALRRFPREGCRDVVMGVRMKPGGYGHITPRPQPVYYCRRDIDPQLPAGKDMRHITHPVTGDRYAAIEVTHDIGRIVTVFMPADTHRSVFHALVIHESPVTVEQVIATRHGDVCFAQRAQDDAYAQVLRVTAPQTPKEIIMAARKAYPSFALCPVARDILSQGKNPARGDKPDIST